MSRQDIRPECLKIRCVGQQSPYTDYRNRFKRILWMFVRDCQYLASVTDAIWNHRAGVASIDVNHLSCHAGT